MNYYIADGSTQRGPFTIEVLRAQGIGPDTLVWREGAPNWVPASQVEELVSAGVVSGSRTTGAPPPPPSGGFPPPPAAAAGYPSPYGASSTPAAPPAYNAANSNRVAAGVCGILLGAFGVHKFILGYTTAGVIMLVVTLVTCGFAGIIMHVIGIVEGIIYLTKSDQEFYETYVAQKRDWF